MTTCCSHSKINLLSRFSLFRLRQFLGVAFLAIGLWAWSEKVSFICMYNDKLHELCLWSFSLAGICKWSINSAYQCQSLFVVCSGLCARHGCSGFTESERNFMLSCGTHEQWAINWSDAFHRFIHCVLGAKGSSLGRALWISPEYISSSWLLLRPTHTQMQLILYHYLETADLFSRWLDKLFDWCNAKSLVHRVWCLTHVVG